MYVCCSYGQLTLVQNGRSSIDKQVFYRWVSWNDASTLVGAAGVCTAVDDKTTKYFNLVSSPRRTGC